jgi:hypothetical protein
LFSNWVSVAWCQWLDLGILTVFSVMRHNLLIGFRKINYCVESNRSNPESGEFKGYRIGTIEPDTGKTLAQLIDLPPGN